MKLVDHISYTAWLQPGDWEGDWEEEWRESFRMEIS